jgi:hypothetical protein
MYKTAAPVLNTINHMISDGGTQTARVERASVPSEGSPLEVQFGKPVVARVKKCRLVVVKKRHNQDENDEQAVTH